LSWLLDTNICISFLNGDDERIRDRMLSHEPEELCLCSVVKAELLYGARHSRRVNENLGRLERFFAPFRSLPFDDHAAEIYGVLRAQLRGVGEEIGANDMLIAATALAADVTLVTRNQGEFRRVAGLRIESW
jgi:tRNA(fMet)-specific endonuclease VapC